VAPEERRQGFARRLLGELAATARGDLRRLLVGETSGRVPAGAAFMERLGAAQGLELTTRQLAIAAIDHDLLRDWQSRGAERSPDFELGLWDGPYPEQDLEAAAALHQVMNTQPRGSLALEDHTFTVKDLRLIEAATFARGGKRWTLYARERSTGRLAGFTDVLWIPSWPEVLQQVNTGVFPEYRNRGLARWLKAAMLEKVARERPEVRFVRTANADSNAAMIKINIELGFEPYASQILWQAELERIEAYLSRSRVQ
jgi:GNAT superfamily N-acetyltransferase